MSDKKRDIYNKNEAANTSGIHDEERWRAKDTLKEKQVATSSE